MNHVISRVGLVVPDLDASVEHAVAALGVQEVAGEGRVADLALPGQPPCMRLIEGELAAIDHMTLTTTEDNLDEILGRCEARGIAVAEGDEPGGRSIVLTAPNQLIVNIATGDAPPRNETPRQDGPAIGALDHLGLTAADVDAFVDFFTEVLGFRLSDRVSDKRFWLRCGPNHHTVAVFAGEDGLQHYAFETESILELKKLGDLLASRGQNFLWGPGRHGLGENVFSYHFDPAGAILEVCSDMVQIPDESAWTTKTWREDTTESAIMWGQLPDPIFRQSWIPARSAAVS